MFNNPVFNLRASSVSFMIVLPKRGVGVEIAQNDVFSAGTRRNISGIEVILDASDGRDINVMHVH